MAGLLGLDSLGLSLQCPRRVLCISIVLVLVYESYCLYMNRVSLKSTNSAI